MVPFTFTKCRTEASRLDGRILKGLGGQYLTTRATVNICCTAQWVNHWQEEIMRTLVLWWAMSIEWPHEYYKGHFRLVPNPVQKCCSHTGIGCWVSPRESLKSANHGAILHKPCGKTVDPCFCNQELTGELTGGMHTTIYWHCLVSHSMWVCPLSLLATLGFMKWSQIWAGLYPHCCYGYAVCPHVVPPLWFT